MAYWQADNVGCREDIVGYENGLECCFAFSLKAAILLVHWSLFGLYMYGGAGEAYGQGEFGLFMLVGTDGTLLTMLELILFDGDEKHIGCDGTTEERWGLTELKPHGNDLVPSGLGTLVAHVLL